MFREHDTNGHLDFLAVTGLARTSEVIVVARTKAGQTPKAFFDAERLARRLKRRTDLMDQQRRLELRVSR